MGYFEWNRSDVENAINNAKKNGEKLVTLSMDKNTYENELQVVKWAEEMGCKAKLDAERVFVTIVNDKPFSNLETSLVSKWFNGVIDEMVSENKSLERNNLVCLLSETLENLIKSELEYVSEGFISEIVGNSFDKINYHELIDYYKK